MANVIEINVSGLNGLIFQTKENEDRYSFQLGGFYNWHCPLIECIVKAEAAMKNISNMAIEREFKKVTRKAKKLKLIKNENR